MKTIKKVQIEPIFFDECLPPKEEFEGGKIYISRKYHGAAHLCLCGCGLYVFMDINHENYNYGWDLIENNGKITFSPSIGNFQYPCKSHYIITKNIANFV